MAIEDDRSYHHRFYLWETTREDSERLTMLEEEMDQCQVDTFWGIGAKIHRLIRTDDKYFHHTQIIFFSFHTVFSHSLALTPVKTYNV